MFDCDNCPKSFTGRKAFAAHCKANCGRNYHTHRDYPQQAFYLTRFRTSYPDKNTSIMFECDNCPKSFTSSLALAAHWKANCGSMTCDLCDRPYKSKRALTEHLKTYCRQCETSASFFTLQALEQYYNQDLATHTESDMCCLLKDESAKEQHMYDSADKDIFCAICNKSFKKQKYLRKHRSTKHKGKQDSKLRAQTSTHKCPICPKTFRALYSMEAHLNSPAHVDYPEYVGNEFKCPKCDTHFKLVSGLVQHFESSACGLYDLGDVERRCADMQAQLSRSFKF